MAAAPADVGLTEMEVALADAPIWEKQVLEIGLEWPEFFDFSEEEQWAASRLRTFLLTWDPFEWQSGRPAAFATSTNRGADVGLVLYVPLWRARDRRQGLASWLGRLGESILSVASEFRGAITDGSFPAGVQSGRTPGLLSRIPPEALLDPPVLSLVADGVTGPAPGGAAGWRPIQFDVLEDLAQDGFGPADLDRSPVEFTEVGEGRSGCPGCAGQSVGFPDGLKDAQEDICGPHRAEALRITTARLEASKASNPAGWEALLEAGQHLVEPHLPNGLGPRLVAAAEAPTPTAAQLADAAMMVVAAAALMAGLPDPQTALGGRMAPVRPWLERFPVALADAGLTDEAAQASTAAQELLTAPSAAVQAAAEEAAAAVAKPQPYRRETRVGRNQPCPCGSGKKYKFCHG